MRKIFVFIIVLFVAAVNLRADGDLEEVKANLPKMLGTSNMGTEFYLTLFPAWEVDKGGNFIKIFFASAVESKVKLEIVGVDLDKSINIRAGETYEFNLRSADIAPYGKHDDEKPLAEQVFEGRGIHIKADNPVLVYCVLRYRGIAEGYLALPVQCLGKSYIVASYMDADGRDKYLSSYTGIVSTHDANEVEFTLGGHDSSKTAGGMVYGETKPFSMNSSDVVLIGSVGKHSDLTGSVIKATHPVAVVSGNFCVNVPQNTGYCDYIIEMEMPTELWGYSYNVSPIYSRKKPGIIKIFAKEKNTYLFYEGKETGVFIKTAGGCKGEGWLEMRASDPAALSIPVNIRGDKPINVVYYNTSSSDDNIESAPFQMNILADRHYSKYYEFVTPGVNGGKTFENNYLNIIYRATESGSIPEEMYLGKLVDSSLNWDRLVDIYPNPGIQLTGTEQDGRSYYSKDINIDSVGYYVLKGEEPFAVYMHGQDENNDSYGYPAGGAFTSTAINDSKAPILINEEGSGQYISGEFGDLAAEGEEASGMRALFFIGSESCNYNFSREAWSWELELGNDYKIARAVLYACDKRGNDTLIEYLYSPFGLIASCDELEFKNCVAGKDYEQSIILNNLSDKVIDIESIVLGKGDDFSIVSDEISQIGAKSQEDIKIRFRADSDFEYSDELIVNYGDSKELRVALSGHVKSISVVLREEEDVVGVYPNPVRVDELMVDLGDSGAVEFDIYDMDGRVIRSCKTGSERVLKLDINDLQSGRYVLILKSRKGIVARESFTVVK